jgi:hypothetical protein
MLDDDDDDDDGDSSGGGADAWFDVYRSPLLLTSEDDKRTARSTTFGFLDSATTTHAAEGGDLESSPHKTSSRRRPRSGDAEAESEIFDFDSPASPPRRQLSPRDRAALLPRYPTEES